jgi:hypothetical protein
VAIYKAGQILRFTYRPPKPTENPVDQFKEVLVLHPNWQGKMHAIDLKRLTPAEREVLDAVMDPAQRGKPHRIALVNDILRRMDPLTEIRNPMSFYSKFVKVFLRRADAYRTYYSRYMLAVTVAQKSDVKGKVINPKPLFHKVGGTPDSASRLETLKQRNQARQQAQKPPAKPDRMQLIRQRAELQRAKKPGRPK